MRERKTTIGGDSLDDGQPLIWSSTAVRIEDLQSPQNLSVKTLQEGAVKKVLDDVRLLGLLVDPLLNIALANRVCYRLGQQPENLQFLCLSVLFSGKPVVIKIQHAAGDGLA